MMLNVLKNSGNNSSNSGNRSNVNNLSTTGAGMDNDEEEGDKDITKRLRYSGWGCCLDCMEPREGSLWEQSDGTYVHMYTCMVLVYYSIVIRSIIVYSTITLYYDTVLH